MLPKQKERCLENIEMYYYYVVKETGLLYLGISSWWRLTATAVFQGGFKYVFYVHANLWGNDPIWRAYFSNGLQPPTRKLFWLQWKYVCFLLPKEVNLWEVQNLHECMGQWQWFSSKRVTWLWYFTSEKVFSRKLTWQWKTDPCWRCVYQVFGSATPLTLVYQDNSRWENASREDSFESSQKNSWRNHIHIQLCCKVSNQEKDINWLGFTGVISPRNQGVFLMTSWMCWISIGVFC